MNPLYEEEITYHQFKNWIIQQICTFILEKIHRIYVTDLPKKPLKDWMSEFTEWCKYDEVIKEPEIIREHGK